MSDEAYERIGSALDRFQEAHFWIHMMEENFHFADPFRWYLNVFLKAIKEVPDLIKMELQNDGGFKAWYSPYAEGLGADPLLRFLAKRRDFVVHRGALKLKSGGTIGITEGRGIKFGFTVPVHPLEDSDAAIERYLRVVIEKGDFFGFLREDEDSLPCVERHWKMPEFEDEILDVCAKAWLRTGETIAEVLRWLGASPPPLSLDCRHSSQQVHFKLYKREKLAERLEQLRQGETNG